MCFPKDSDEFCGELLHLPQIVRGFFSFLTYIYDVPLAMISGAWFEAEQMPAVVTRVAGVFPFLHVMQASRYVINGGMFFGNISHDLYWLIGWTVAMFAIGIAVFRRGMSS